MPIETEITSRMNKYEQEYDVKKKSVKSEDESGIFVHLWCGFLVKKYLLPFFIFKPNEFSGFFFKNFISFYILIHSC